MAETILDRVQRVANLRGVLKILAEDKKARFSAWESENITLLNAISVSTLALAEAENTLRAEAIKIYQETGSKTPGPGLGIRWVTKLDYAPGAALAWATEHGLALRLDVKAFERIAKMTDILCVAGRSLPEATIAQDLEAVLKDVKEA